MMNQKLFKIADKLEDAITAELGKLSATDREIIIRTLIDFLDNYEKK